MSRWMIGSLIQSTLKRSQLLTLSRTAFRWNLNIRKIRVISPNLIYFADRNGLLLSGNVLIFYLLLIPSPPPPVVFQHRTLPSLSNVYEKGWFRVRAICESVLNQVVRIPNYWGGLRASWEEPSQGVVRVIKNLEKGDWRKKMEAKRKRERWLKNIWWKNVKKIKEKLERSRQLKQSAHQVRLVWDTLLWT